MTTLHYPITTYVTIHSPSPQILWMAIPQEDKPQSRNSYEGCLEIREIHELRAGKNSKDFDKWSDDNKRSDPQTCLVVLYGQEFKLRTLSIVAYSVMVSGNTFDYNNHD